MPHFLNFPSEVYQTGLGNDSHRRKNDHLQNLLNILDAIWFFSNFVLTAADWLAEQGWAKENEIISPKLIVDLHFCKEVCLFVCSNVNKCRRCPAFFCLTKTSFQKRHTKTTTNDDTKLLTMQNAIKDFCTYILRFARRLALGPGRMSDPTFCVQKCSELLGDSSIAQSWKSF